MNRRSLLAFIGLAPVAVATGAVAAEMALRQTANEYLKELSAKELRAKGTNLGEFYITRHDGCRFTLTADQFVIHD